MSRSIKQKAAVEPSLPRLVRHLDSAHAELVAARKIAALSKHDSYEEIGDAIECVEAAFIWLHSQPNTGITGGTSSECDQLTDEKEIEQ